MRSDHALGKRGDIAQGEIQALGGDRVQALRGSADQHTARRGDALGEDTLEHEAPTRGDGGQPAQPPAEPGLQFAEKGRVIHGQQACGLGRRARPDQCRTTVLHRQQREWTLGREAFVGDALMRPFRGDGAQQRRMAVVMTRGRNARLRAQVRLGTVGRDHEPRMQHARPVARTHLDLGVCIEAAAGTRLGCQPRDAGQHCDARGEDLVDRLRGQHMAKHRHGRFAGIQHRHAEAPAFADVHLEDRLSHRTHRLPQAERGEDAARGFVECDGARIVASRHRAAGLDEGDADAVRGKRDGECRAHRPTADDDHRRHATHARVIRASMAATDLGAASVNTSQPSRVTSTSSSMRTPMFQ